MNSDSYSEVCRRESTGGHGPDFCRPCSEAIQDWVPWKGHTTPVEARHAWWCSTLAIDLAHACDCHVRHIAAVSVPSGGDQ